MAKSGAVTTKARGGSSRTPTIAAIAVVVVLAAVVFGGIFLFRDDAGDTTSAIPPSPVAATYRTAVEGGVVRAGAPTAPTTLDVYEDALCPACQQFEALYGQKIGAALDAGKVQVRYHLVNLLDDSSRPAGYSSEGGNAIMCAAENNAFAAVHKSLYDAQPAEGGAGYTAAQLVDLGNRVGAGPGYAACVQGGTHKAAIAANYQQASSDPALQQSSGGSTGFGTPTILIDGRMAAAGSAELDQALA